MMISLKIVLLPLSFIRRYSIKVKPVVVADENVLNSIHNSEFKPRKHPGVTNHKAVILPDEYIKAIVNCTQDYPVKALLANCEHLSRHLKGKNPPMEKEELKSKVEKIKNKVLTKFKDFTIKTEEDEIRFKQKVQNKVDSIIKEKIYNWRPVKYDTYNSLLYLMARSAAEYAVLVKIFGEISDRHPEFKPRCLFDFGSGLGTATWAAQTYWKKHIFEYINIDSSREMNDLALTLLQGGMGSGNLPKGTFYRQFLPASKNTYDLVISAYSLMELPSLQSRLQTIVNLWNKTEHYLVIVEQGTNAGFKLVNEVRDFILQVKNESNKGHVFSPCPHDDTCPRFLLDDGTPCNFEVTHFTLPVGQVSKSRTELYSYVVLKKGKKSEKNDLEWPRIVRPTLVRPKHTICRVCTAKGKLNEVIFTSKRHGKVTYHCARASKWGDRLPLTVDFQTINEMDSEISCDSTNEVNDVSDTVSNSASETINDDVNKTISNSKNEAISNSVSETFESKDCKNTGEYA